MVHKDGFSYPVDAYQAKDGSTLYYYSCQDCGREIENRCYKLKRVKGCTRCKDCTDALRKKRLLKSIVSKDVFTMDEIKDSVYKSIAEAKNNNTRIFMNKIQFEMALGICQDAIFKNLEDLHEQKQLQAKKEL